jgi:acyl-coenzyme A thioesterase PaaI-like protein
MERTSPYQSLKLTLGLRLFGFLKIPLVAYIRPTVVTATAAQVVVKVPLRRRTKNHLNSMYFGVLASGADLTAGFLTMDLIKRSGARVSMIFKDFKADFSKRAEGDVHFRCDQGREIADLVARAVATGERVELPVTVTAEVPGKLQEPAAVFTLTLSLKKR